MNFPSDNFPGIVDVASPVHAYNAVRVAAAGCWLLKRNPQLSQLAARSIRDTLEPPLKSSVFICDCN